MSEIDAQGFQRINQQDMMHLFPRAARLSPFLLLLMNSRGIFPFLHNSSHSLWWSPDPRSVLLPSEIHVSRSLQKILRRGQLRVTADVVFEDVVRNCRLQRSVSWLDTDLETMYGTLHRLGHAHSVETWRGDRLVGGLYGIAVGQLFIGCSMFHIERDASKVALVKLCERMPSLGIEMIDCQVHTPHLQHLGAKLLPRTEFTDRVARLVRGRRRLGLWTENFT